VKATVLFKTEAEIPEDQVRFLVKTWLKEKLGGDGVYNKGPSDEKNLWVYEYNNSIGLSIRDIRLATQQDVIIDQLINELDD